MFDANLWVKKDNAMYLSIFTMVSYFLRWALLKFFSLFSDEQSQQKVRQWSRITCVAINTSIEVKCPLLWEFWIYNLPRRILERVFIGSIVNIRNECLFSLGLWGMNRCTEQTNRTRTASRFTQFVCPALRFIPHEPRKKDTHSLKIQCSYVYFPFLHMQGVAQLLILSVWKWLSWFRMALYCWFIKFLEKG